MHQRESEFDQRIREYQDELEKANLKTQHIQAELVKLEEEKTKSDDTINSLQKDLDILKTEFQDQGLILFLWSMFLHIHCRSYAKHGTKRA